MAPGQLSTAQQRRPADFVCPLWPRRSPCHRCAALCVERVSPFGLRRPMRVYVERSVAQLTGPAEADSEDAADDEASIVINGGGRGLLVRMALSTLMRALDSPQLIDVTAAPKKEASSGQT